MKGGLSVLEGVPTRGRIRLQAPSAPTRSLKPAAVLPSAKAIRTLPAASRSALTTVLFHWIFSCGIDAAKRLRSFTRSISGDSRPSSNSSSFFPCLSTSTTLTSRRAYFSNWSFRPARSRTSWPVVGWRSREPPCWTTSAEASRS